MTKDDTIRILEKVCRLYFTQAKKMTSREKAMMIDTWHETFKSESYDRMDRAFGNYVKRGNAFMPLPGDIIKELTALDKTSGGRNFTEGDKLFKKLADAAETLANNKERISITDPGGFSWDEELQRNTYHHAESILSTSSYTQYDFKQLPVEVQEYVEDIEGLRNIWREISSSRELARRRFVAALPGIKAEIAERDERLIREHEERKRAMQ